MKFSFFKIFIFLSLFISRLVFPSEINVDQIRQAIKEKGASWTAGETWLTRLPEEQRQRALGLLREPAGQSQLFKLPPAENLPAHFSWADNYGNFITSVKDQGLCGACSYFATMAAVESWMRIKTGNPRLDIDLSEQYVLSCGNVGSCENGAYIQGVHRFVRDFGVPGEACFPYKMNDKVPCSEACPGFADELVSIGDFVVVSYEQASVDDIKNAVFHRPVVAGMEAFTDFMSYTGGVYEYVEGKDEGGHAVLIYGWDDAQQCWLCKNSWNEGWGEKGHFRIKWGEAEIGSPLVMIWDDAAGSPRMAVSPSALNLTLSPGETAIRHLTVKNVGSGTLEFATKITADNMPRAFFHQSDFHSLDGQSWWCGSERLQGYDNEWLQYLQTPVLDFSATANPRLQFKAFWALQSDSCDQTGYDGWDGCNVWISENGGTTFELLQPVQPAYTCTSLYGFGETWGLGFGIAGWSGKSSTWQDAVFDLSGHNSAQTVIRFALASDDQKSGRDALENAGFFIDDIQITDGGKTIFSDSGDLNSAMNVLGRGSDQTQWLTLPFATAALNAGEFLDIPVEINTSHLASGRYDASIEITNNHRRDRPKVIPLSVNVDKAEHDVSVGKMIAPLYHWPRLMNFSPTVLLKNWGQYDEENIVMQCRIIGPGGDTIFSDEQIAGELPAGASLRCAFPTVSPADSGDYHLLFKAETSAGDDNPGNDELEAWIHVAPLIDDFEQKSALWDYGQGWGMTDHFTGGYQSKYAMHVNSGERYSDNMDNSLVLLSSFDLSNVAFAALSFRVRYSMEKGKDYLLIQAANNKKKWATLDSLTGANLRWRQHKVDLTSFCGHGNDSVFVRFRFISNESHTSIGPMIDNVKISTENVTKGRAQKSALLPRSFSLEQNYPNPYNPVTTIAYRMSEPALILLQIFNLNGQVIAELVNAEQSPGLHKVSWDAHEKASGIYIYRLEAVTKSGERFRAARKMLLVK